MRVKKDSEPEATEASELEGAVGPEAPVEGVDERMEALVGEVRQLHETVQAQAGQLEELGRRVAEME